ncbi:phage baseplate upper protein [Staphylococcus epidermidis]|uniref:phage baseplate upper protein n=1 Tax=Staphylococcus epidermidis TaxID=1282 RepID=UPI00111B2174|nr:phage baseplate upper protein [Staphylococcus epidermidis]MBM6026724.1 phage baseplate upper protein [Staphylococcus epidermidis]MBM6033381.1 phage baseplate upper protein [Staphylococcus epidermidis]MBM6035685.1 phage baseplate upper protein [Staphylococcus epidermidis]MBM6037885.1 phage baseplate upper protein [Staphylococcus epidermidis]MBM6053840.1 phage baseplate upper protein [Staphylococcus epidermidis]
MENFLKDDNKLELDVTSRYGQVIDTDIRFFTSDRGTAVLNFMAIKNKLPLSISANHAKASIVLKTENYNIENGAYISDDLEIIDAINGRMQYVIPDEFLKYNGKVEAQVYFTQNGNGNVVVERSFTFKIDNDLISNFDGATKLTYIKSMKDLTDNIEDEVKNIKSSLSDAKTIVGSIENEFHKGVQQLEIKKNDFVEMITTTQNNALEKLNAEYDEIKNKSDYVTQKITEYENNISEKDLLKKETTSNWQKHKLTNDDGTILKLSDTNINDVLNNAKTTQVVYISGATDAPSITSYSEDEEHIEDGVPDDNELENEVIKTTVNQSMSGILSIYIVNPNIGKCTWEPDNSNDIYMSHKENGVWFPFERYNDQNITRDYIETEDMKVINQTKEYIDSKVDNSTVQKHKLTNDNGLLEVIDILGNRDKFTSLNSGFYYVINPPDTPNDITVKEGYLKVFVKDYGSKLYEFTPVNSDKVIKRRLVDNKLDDNWFRDNEYKKTLLFDGSANGVGTEITLNDYYTNYSLLVISGNYPGGTFCETSLTSIPNNIIISKTNIIDSDASGGGLYEAVVQKLNSKTLKIINDVMIELPSMKGSGANANRITIKRIEGWK